MLIGICNLAHIYTDTHILQLIGNEKNLNSNNGNKSYIILQ